jgi:RND family efflux transporter MFP subunit
MFLRADHAKDLADPDRARREGRPIPVRTDRVREAEFEEVIGATAVTVPSATAVIRVGPSRDLNLSAPQSEIVVKEVRVREGERVTRGQALFEIDGEVYRALDKQREVALAKARAELERIKQAVAYNERVRDMHLHSVEAEVHFRTEDLANRQAAFDIISKLSKDRASTLLDYYNARSKLAEAKFMLTDAQHRLQKARNSLRLGALSDDKELARAANDVETAEIDHHVARRDVERCVVRSPLDGYVSRLDTVAGSVITVNATLTQVLQTDPIWVQVDFPQERLDSLALGQQAEVILDSFPKETFQGTVVRLLPQVRPDLRVLPVMVELANPNGRIRAGVSGFVRLRQARKGTLVPSVAVIEHGQKAAVFRVEDGRAHLCPVTTGRLVEPGVLEVRDGLAAGDEVVVFHSNFYRHGGSLERRQCFLQDNDPVDTDWRRWTRRE